MSEEEATETSTEEEVDTTGETQEEDTLGEAGKRALNAERSARKAVEKQLKDLTSKLDKYEEESKSEHDKALDKARAEARSEALREASERIAQAEILAIASNHLADPEDATRFLNMAEYVDDNGDIDNKAIKTAIERLIKEKPYLAKIAKAGPLPGGGAKPADTTADMDSWLRQQAAAKQR